VQGERVGEPLPLGDQLGVRVRRVQRQGQHGHRLVGEAQPVQRLACPGAALQRRAEQVGAQPAVHVRTGPDAQQVQGDQRGRVGQRPHPLVAERPGHRRPDRAEHLVAGPDRDRDAGQRHLVRLGRHRLDVDRPRAAVQLLEHAAFGEQAGVPLGHLAAQDGRHPGWVGLVLAAGERQHPQAAVLDGHRRVEQCGDRVGQREQVTGGHAAERGRFRVADVALGQQAT
jgi:hypothetical protein